LIGRSSAWSRAGNKTLSSRWRCTVNGGSIKDFGLEFQPRHLVGFLKPNMTTEKAIPIVTAPVGVEPPKPRPRRPAKPVLERKAYSYECEETGFICDGLEWSINWNVIHSSSSNDAGWIAVLKHFGINLELIELNENGDQTWLVSK
jgi:hypothetical protein